MRLNKKIILNITLLCPIVIISSLNTTSCSNRLNFDKEVADFYDGTIYDNQSEALNQPGPTWYKSSITDFSTLSDGAALPTPWNPSPTMERTGGRTHWVPEAPTIKDGECQIRAEGLQNQTHWDQFPTTAVFSGGIDTQNALDGQQYNPTFEQAFGCFEITCKYPNDDGMWSAFWLQCNSEHQMGNNGWDGSEIDVFESAFWDRTPYRRNWVGNALLWDGYSTGAGVVDHEYIDPDLINSQLVDLYDDYHTYRLMWTPIEYIFSIDNHVTWHVTGDSRSGISQVPEFVRCTVETNYGRSGPHGEVLGNISHNGGSFFDNDAATFNIKSINIYQNTGFLNYIKSPSDFK